MPYKADGSDAPANIKKLSARSRRRWVATWNAAFTRCKDKNGADCEGTAFRIANSTLRPRNGSS